MMIMMMIPAVYQGTRCMEWWESRGACYRGKTSAQEPNFGWLNSVYVGTLHCPVEKLHSM